MATIHQILNLPDGGSALAVGPIQILAAFPAKQTKNGKSYSNFKVKDSSGEADMTIWADVSGLGLTKGRTVTIKGNIKKNVYNEKVSISIEKPSVSGAEASGGSSGGAAADSVSMQELIDYGLKCVAYARSKGEQSEAVLASVYGSAMFGFKEGRPLARKAPQKAPEPPVEDPVADDNEIPYGDDDTPF